MAPSPECLVQSSKFKVQRASHAGPLVVSNLARNLGASMEDLALTFSHYERRYGADGWMYLVAVYLDSEGRARILPADD